MFELISRRYQNKSTLVTTNRPFAEWREVFPNAACVVSLVDRLLHNAEMGFHAQTLEIFDPMDLGDVPAQTPYLSVSLSRSR